MLIRILIITISIFCVNSALVMMAPELYQRLAFLEITNCDNFTFHGRALTTGCASFAKNVKARGPTAIGDPMGSPLLKYIDDVDNTEVEFVAYQDNKTNMKYKAFLPNMKNNQLDDLDSKLPYVVFRANSQSLPVTLEAAENAVNLIVKIIIFSCDQDVDDFLYENNFSSNYTSPLKYAVKKTGVDIVGDNDIKNKVTVAVTP